MSITRYYDLCQCLEIKLLYQRCGFQEGEELCFKKLESNTSSETAPHWMKCTQTFAEYCCSKIKCVNDIISLLFPKGDNSVRIWVNLVVSEAFILKKDCTAYKTKYLETKRNTHEAGVQYSPEHRTCFTLMWALASFACCSILPELQWLEVSYFTCFYIFYQSAALLKKWCFIYLSPRIWGMIYCRQLSPSHSVLVCSKNIWLLSSKSKPMASFYSSLNWIVCLSRRFARTQDLFMGKSFRDIHNVSFFQPIFNTTKAKTVCFWYG